MAIDRAKYGDELLEKLRKSEETLAEISNMFGEYIPAEDFQNAESLPKLFRQFLDDICPIGCGQCSTCERVNDEIERKRQQK